MTTPELALSQDGVEADYESAEIKQDAKDTNGACRAPHRPLEEDDLLASPKLITRGSKARLRTLLAQTVGDRSAANESSRPTLCAPSTGCDETCNDQVTCSRLSKASKSAQSNQANERRADESHEMRAAAIPGVQPMPRIVSGRHYDRKRSHKHESRHSSKRPKPSSAKPYRDKYADKGQSEPKQDPGYAVNGDYELYPDKVMNYFLNSECDRLFYSPNQFEHNQSYEFSEDVIRDSINPDIEWTAEDGRYLHIQEYEKMLEAKLERSKLEIPLDHGVISKELPESPGATQFIQMILDGSMDYSEEDMSLWGTFVPREHLNKGIYEWGADGSIWVPAGKKTNQREVALGRVYHVDRMRNCVVYAFFDQRQLPTGAAPIANHGVVQRISNRIPTDLNYNTNRGMPWMFGPRSAWVNNASIEVDMQQLAYQSTCKSTTFIVANAGQDVKAINCDILNAEEGSKFLLIVGRDNKGEFYKNEDLERVGTPGFVMVFRKDMPQWHFSGRLTATVNGIANPDCVKVIDGAHLCDLLDKVSSLMLRIEELTESDVLPARSSNTPMREYLQRPVVKDRDKCIFNRPFFHTRFWKLQFPYRNSTPIEQDQSTLIMQPIGERWRNFFNATGGRENKAFSNNYIEGWPNQEQDNDAIYYRNIQRIVYSIVFAPVTDAGPDANESVNVVSTVDAYEIDRTVMHYVTIVTPNCNFSVLTTPWIAHQLYPNVKLFQIPAEKLIHEIGTVGMAMVQPIKGASFTNRLICAFSVDKSNPLRQGYIPPSCSFFTQLWHLLWRRQSFPDGVKEMPPLFDPHDIQNETIWDDDRQMDILNSWQPFFQHDFATPDYSEETPLEYCLQNNYKFRIISVENLLKHNDSVQISTTMSGAYKSEVLYMSGAYIERPTDGIPLSSEQLVTQITLEPSNERRAVIFDYTNLTMNDIIRVTAGDPISVLHDTHAKLWRDTTLQSSQNRYFYRNGEMVKFPPRVTSTSYKQEKGYRDNIRGAHGRFPMIRHYLVVTDDLCTGPTTQTPVLFGAINVPHGVCSALVSSRRLVAMFTRLAQERFPATDLEKLKPPSRVNYRCGELWREANPNHKFEHHRQRVIGIINSIATERSGTVDRSVWNLSDSDSRDESILYFLCPGVKNHHLAVEGSRKQNRTVYHLDYTESENHGMYISHLLHCFRNSASPMFDLRHGYALTTPYEHERNTWIIKREDDRKNETGGKPDSSHPPPKPDSKHGHGGGGSYPPREHDSSRYESQGGRHSHTQSRPDEPPRSRNEGKDYGYRHHSNPHSQHQEPPRGRYDSRDHGSHGRHEPYSRSRHEGGGHGHHGSHQGGQQRQPKPPRRLGRYDGEVATNDDVIWEWREMEVRWVRR